jgi:predicted ArsR family transcriptional regulator
MTPTAPRERDAPPDTRVHRALSSDVRTRLLDVLRREPDLDATALAERLDLHVNTVRSHLAVLEDAGLVEAITEDRSRPGRPRRLHRVVESTAPTALADDRGYRFLAQVLASYLGATAEDAAAEAEQAGAAWGRFVVDAPAPFVTVDADGAVERLVDLLGEFGFEPHLEGGDDERPEVVLQRCPFLDVAREHQDVVCSIHLGLMRGALDELGVDVEVEDLIPWARPDACVSHLHVPAG